MFLSYSGLFSMTLSSPKRDKSKDVYFPSSSNSLMARPAAGACCRPWPRQGGREGGRKEGRKGESRKGGRKGGKEGGREGGRLRAGREEGREGGREDVPEKPLAR